MRRWAAPVALAAVAVAAVAALVAGPAQGIAAKSVRLDDVQVWLLSSSVGEAELVDGNSDAVVTHVKLGAGTLSGVQSGVHVFVADSATGKVRRIDGATYEVSPAATFGKAGDVLGVYQAEGTLFAVDQTTGLVSLADPKTLAVRKTYSLPAKIALGGVVTEGADVLWAVDATTGDLERVDPAGTTMQRHAVDPAHTVLATAGGRPVAVDLSAGRATELGPDGITGTAACIDVAADDPSVSVVGSSAQPFVYTVSGKRGVLLVSDLATGKCGEAVNLGVQGDWLGQPHEAGGRVFVPDYTSGQVLVVDVAAGQVIADPAVLPSSTVFELREHGTSMFYNDPKTAIAGVISLGGSTHKIEKYDPSKLGGLLLGGGTPLPNSQTTDSTPKPQQQTQPQPGQQTQPQPPAEAQPDQQTEIQPPAEAQPANGQPTARIAVSAPQAQIGAKLTMQAVFVAADGTISTNGISQVAWAFGDDGTASGLSASHSWSAAGDYTVTATVRLTNGSTLPAQTTIRVIGQIPPSAELAVSPRSGGAPLAVTADASGSRAGAAPIASYQFDFGDGTTGAASSAAAAKHTYAASGTYNVQVTVKDTAGNSSVAYATVTARAAGTTGQGKPTAALTVSPNSGEAALKVTANATGSKPGGAAISQYVFDFGDGTAAVTSTSGTTTHTFSRGGNYTVTVTVTETAGQSATETASVSVSAGIIPSLHVTTGGASSLTITADGSGSTSSTPMQFQFDFGDGTTTGPSPQSAVQHTYGAAGTYKVVMTVTDTAGSMSDYGTATVTVPSGGCTLDPGMSTNTTRGPAPLAVTVTMSEPCDPGPVTYEYDFGDGTKPTTTATSQSHTYSTSGTYYITVTATAGSQTARRVATITITSAATPAKPRITANPTTACSYVWITMDASGTTPGSTPITDYTWTFSNMDQGISTRDTGTTPTTQWRNQASGGIGDWTITVTVTDGTGSYSASTTVTIKGPMIASECS